MTFKFQLLNLERKECNCNNPKTSTMAKRKGNQKSKFSKTASKCKGKSRKKFISCMKKGLKK